MQEMNVPEALRVQGARLKRGYSDLVQAMGMADITGIKGHPARTLITFNAETGDPLLLKSLMQQELIKRGVLWSGFHNMSYSHSDEDVNYTLETYETVLPTLKQAVANGNVQALLRGIPVQPVFRKTGNFNLKPRAAINGKASS